MNAIVYTTKLDNMKSLKNQFFAHVKSDVLINEVLIESKPVMRMQTTVEEIVNQNNDVTNKNLSNDAAHGNLNTVAVIDIPSHPINPDEVPRAIYFGKTDETNIEIKIEVDPNEDDNKDNDSVPNTDMDVSPDEPEASEDEYEDVRVNPNSKVFKKPNNLSYNPVQLCKNPDFNTRLKRIPILFFTYQSNKEYLKECKPVTIDLDKSFERKMYNNTIYLKRDPNAVKVEVAPTIRNDDMDTVTIQEEINQPVVNQVSEAGQDQVRPRRQS